MHRANGNPLEQSPSTVIGTNEIAPLSLAVAFAGIANNGVTCSPIAIDRIVGRDGKEVAPPKSICTQSVSPEVAAGMHYALRRVMTSGTAQQSNQNTVPQVPLIGKTGTTDGAKDTWMAGASTKVATVAAVVSVTGDRNQRGTSFDSGQAATARHRMWPMVMSVAAAKYGGDEFTEAAPGPVESFDDESDGGDGGDEPGNSGGDGPGNGPGNGPGGGNGGPGNGDDDD